MRRGHSDAPSEWCLITAAHNLLRLWRSGQTIVDPFLVFLRRVLWNNKNPSSLGEGVFATPWILKHVMVTHAGGGIGGEPQIAALEPRGEAYIAGFLPEEEFEEHKRNIAGLEDSIGD